MSCCKGEADSYFQLILPIFLLLGNWVANGLLVNQISIFPSSLEASSTTHFHEASHLIFVRVQWLSSWVQIDLYSWVSDSLSRVHRTSSKDIWSFTIQAQGLLQLKMNFDNRAIRIHLIWLFFPKALFRFLCFWYLQYPTCVTFHQSFLHAKHVDPSAFSVPID